VNARIDGKPGGIQGVPVDTDRDIIADWRGRNNNAIGRHYESFDGLGNVLLPVKGLHFGTRCLTSYNVTASMDFKNKCDGTTDRLGSITLKWPE
jgi:hypothetical protein